MSKILVIRGGALGDFILTTPILQLLKRELDTEIHLMGYEPFISIAKQAELVQDTISIESGNLVPFFIANNEKGDLPQELVDSFSQYSVVISYLFDPGNHFTENLKLVGVKTLLQGIHKPIETDPPIHATAQLAEPLEKIALYYEPENLTPINWKNKNPNQDTISIHPGSGSPKKNWGLDNWLKLVQLINKSYPNSPIQIITGEVEEEHKIALEIEAKLENQLPNKTIHLRNLPLVEICHYLAGTTLFVGHDSGVTHLASSLGIPTLSLFGPTEPAIWAPPHHNSQVIIAPENILAKLTSENVIQHIRKVI